MLNLKKTDSRVSLSTPTVVGRESTVLQLNTLESACVRIRGQRGGLSVGGGGGCQQLSNTSLITRENISEMARLVDR